MFRILSQHNALVYPNPTDEDYNMNLLNATEEKNGI